MKDVLEIIATAIGIIATAVGGLWFLISLYAKKQKEIENLKATNTKTALNRLDDEVKSFRSAIDSIHITVKELNASFIQSRSDIALLKERLDDTKKLLERYEKNHDDKIKNAIKTEIHELTKQLMLIRTKKT